MFIGGRIGPHPPRSATRNIPGSISRMSATGCILRIVPKNAIPPLKASIMR